MVYEMIVYKHFGGDDYPQTDRSEIRFGTVYRNLDEAKEVGIHTMRYDMYMEDDQPRWFDAMGTVSNYTGKSGVRYIQVRHLVIR